MMIVSAKVSKRKFLTGLLIAAAVIALLVVLCDKAGASGDRDTQTQIAEGKASTNEERLAFLRSFGWDVTDAPTETQEVRIPEEFNEVFTRYNQLQQAQGYDLSPYAGKVVKRYVYQINNHPNGADYYATILIHKNEIIGGDITGTGTGGAIHGFHMPD